MILLKCVSLALIRIKTNVKPVVEEDFKKLESFSAKHGQTDQLEAYDIEFWRNQYTQHHHKLVIIIIFLSV